MSNKKHQKDKPLEQCTPNDDLRPTIDREGLSGGSF